MKKALLCGIIGICVIFVAVLVGHQLAPNTVPSFSRMAYRAKYFMTGTTPTTLVIKINVRD